ncbi:MAG: hypothetical protein A2Y21_05815 [Clostridiales bacterium GWC2_40_7]|nr:MAG: hypothetical protein A2Y21_05815 [Clostridiales bacterium GWC2_40_7]
MYLGNNIKKLRKARKLTSVQLAAMADVRPQFISQIENGKRTPSLKILQKISVALNTTTSELLGEVPLYISEDMKRLVDAADGLNRQQVDAVINVVREINSKYKE